jgi:predicted ester cyclase
VTTTDTTTANIELARRIQKEVFEGGDPSALDELISPEFTDHAAPDPSVRGPESMRRTVAFLHSGLDDLRYEFQDVIAAGDRVVFRVACSATHARTFLGHPATGRRFTVEQIHILRVAGGQIAEHWACRDDVSMMRQLGIIGP